MFKLGIIKSLDRTSCLCSHRAQFGLLSSSPLFSFFAARSDGICNKDGMNDVLKMLLNGESLSTEQMAKILAREPAAIEADLAQLKADNILLGWRPVLHQNAAGETQVRA